MRTKTTLLTAALATVLLLAGCSGTDGDTPTASATLSVPAPTTPATPAQATAAPVVEVPALVDDKQAKLDQFVRGMQIAIFADLNLSDDDVRAATSWVCANTPDVDSGQEYDEAANPAIVGASDRVNRDFWLSAWANGLCA